MAATYTARPCWMKPTARCSALTASRKAFFVVGMAERPSSLPWKPKAQVKCANGSGRLENLLVWTSSAQMCCSLMSSIPESTAFGSGDWSELKEVREDNCLRPSLKDNATNEERRVLVCEEELEYVSAESTRPNGVISMDAICAASVLIADCSADWLLASMVMPAVCMRRTVGPDKI